MKLTDILKEITLAPMSRVFPSQYLDLLSALTELFADGSSGVGRDKTIDEEYNNVWGGLPVTIDFKIVKEISCDTDIQSNKKAYEVKILSIKER